MNLLTMIVLTILTSINANKYWGNFSDSEKQYFLQSKNIPANAVKLYYDKFELSYDVSTVKLLNYLTSNQTDVEAKAFNFYLFNKIVKYSDGSLAEILPKYILNMILLDVPYVFDYFKMDNHLRDTYCILLGTEFYFKECDTSAFPYTFNQFKEKIRNELNSSKNDKEISIVFDKIQKQMDTMD